MTDIQPLLNQIKTAVYGKDVRDAIHDSIAQCYTDTTDGVNLATAAANQATAALGDISGLNLSEPVTIAAAIGAANQAASDARSAATTASQAASTIEKADSTEILQTLGLS